MSKIYDYIKGRYGMETYLRVNKLADKVDGLTRVLEANGDRMAFLIVNLGAVPIYLSMDTKASTTHGIYLSSNGGVMSASIDTDFSLVGEEWYAWSESETDVYIIEVIGK